MDHLFIARNMTHLVLNDPECHVSDIIAKVQKLWSIGYSYKKAWEARKVAMELVYGDWPSTWITLPKYMHVL
jgi:hypothetical protein